MQFEEKIYFRESLGVLCSSSQLAFSHLDGRVGETENFTLNGARHSFTEILQQDMFLREIIRSHGGQVEAFPKVNKFSGFGARWGLFKKIVLRGDDSLSSLLCEVEERKEQISICEEGQRELARELSCLKKNNEDLIDVCQNAVQVLRDFGDMAEAQNHSLVENFGADHEICGQITILRQVSASLAKKLENNIVAVKVADVQSTDRVIDNVDAIGEIRKETEADLAKKKEELKRQKEEWEKQVQLMDADWSDSRKQDGKDINAIDSAMQLLGDMEEKIRHKAKEIFSEIPANERCYISPGIPKQPLYNAIQECWGEVAPKDVLAVFDCSPEKNGTIGILVSTSAFYFYNGMTKRKYKFQENNIIKAECSQDGTPKVEERQNGNPALWIFLCVLSILLTAWFSVHDGEDNKLKFLFFGLALIFFFIGICGERQIQNSVKCHELLVMTFSHGDSQSFVKFCNAINQLGNFVCSTKKQLNTEREKQFLGICSMNSMPDEL